MKDVHLQQTHCANLYLPKIQDENPDHHCIPIVIHDHRFVLEGKLDSNPNTGYEMQNHFGDVQQTIVSSA